MFARDDGEEYSGVTPGGPPDIGNTPGAAFEEEDEQEKSVELVNVTLSSGGDVDLSALPVRVSCNEGDMPMMTPGPSQKGFYNEPANGT